MTKKIITTLLVTVFAFSAFAVELTKADLLSVKTYAEKIAYIESIDSVHKDSAYLVSPNQAGENSIADWKIREIVHTKLGAAHLGIKDAELEAVLTEVKSTLREKRSSFDDMGWYYTMKRAGGEFLVDAVSMMPSLKLDAETIIKDSLMFYKAGVMSKEAAVANILKASAAKIGNWKDIAKEVEKLPSVDNNGDPFMTIEQKVEFYGNFINRNKVTVENADFLGYCKTQYNLVK